MNRTNAHLTGLLGVVVLCFSCSSGGGGGAGAPAPVPPVSSVQVAATAPSDGATQVPLNAQIFAFFSDGIDPTSVQTSSFALYKGNGANQVPGAVLSDGTSATFVPASPLESFVQYRAVLSNQITDAQGLALPSEHSWTFRTQDTVPPAVVSKSPNNGQIFVPLLPAILVNFSEPVDASSVNEASFYLTDEQGALVPGTYSIQGTSASLVPVASLIQENLYTANLTAQIRDLQDNALDAQSWTFRATELIAPAIASTIPFPGQTELPTTGLTIEIALSEPVILVSGSLQTVIQLSGPEGQVPGTVSMPSEDVVRFQASVDLLEGTNYIATFLPLFSDAAGNPMQNGLVWSFRTRVEVLGVPEQLGGNLVGTPVIATNGIGGVAMIFTQQEPNLNKSVYAYYLGPGGWIGPGIIESHGGTAQGLRLALDGLGNAHGAWTQSKAGPSYQLRVNTFNANGGPTSAPSLGIEGNTDPTPQIGADASGKVILAWKEKVGTGKASLYWASKTDSTPWTSPELLESDNTGDVKELSLYVAGNGKACVAWTQTVSGATNLYVRRFDGSSWAAQEILESSAGPASQPVIHGRGDGTYAAVWLQQVDADGNGIFNADDPFNLFANRFDFLSVAEGSWLASPEEIETSNTAISSYSITIDPLLGLIFVTWLETDENAAPSTQIVSNCYDYNAQPPGWLGVESVELSSENVGSPKLAHAGIASVYCVWLQNDPGSSLVSIHAARKLGANGPWEPTDPSTLESDLVSSAEDLALAPIGGGPLASAWKMAGKLWVNIFP